MTLPAFVEKARARSEIRSFPVTLEPQLPAHVSRSLRGDGLRPAQGPLLNHRQQKHHLRGDDREPIASERQAAEALFTPKRQPVEPSVSDPAPSAERSSASSGLRDHAPETVPDASTAGDPRAKTGWLLTRYWLRPRDLARCPGLRVPPRNEGTPESCVEEVDRGVCVLGDLGSGRAHSRPLSPRCEDQTTPSREGPRVRICFPPAESHVRT